MADFPTLPPNTKTTHEASPSISIVCFSKDRPFQLSEFLRSLELFVLQPTVATDIRVTILYTYSDKDLYAASYQKLREQYGQFAEFCKEREGQFTEQLREIIHRCHSEFVMFAVDDIIFYRPFSMDLVVKSFSGAENDLFVFHLKLDPNICFCQPANKVAHQPQFSSPYPLEDGLLIFQGGEGSEDWNYPWDLCCSIYRRETVSIIFSEIETAFGHGGLSHPNRLEVNGNKVLSTLKNEKWFRPLRACPSLSVMSVLTVNRVQNVYINAIYGTDNAIDLERMFQNNPTIRLDLEKYRQSVFDSVHIGETFFDESAGQRSANTGNKREETTKTFPLISVLMCVYNGEEFLLQAVESILHQTFRNFEFVIVDDGSTDGTANILQQARRDDDRVVLVKHSQNKGIAHSLNAGLKVCRGHYIARMDADDISHPERLYCQFHALEAFRSIDILGTAVMTFGSVSQSHRIIRHPMHPDFLHWSMFFFCPLAHPSLMLRRRVFFHPTPTPSSTGQGEETLNGYSTEEQHRSIEDYKCWMDRLESKKYHAMNLGAVLVYLRKHARNASTLKSEEQALQASRCANEALSKRVQQDLPLRVTNFLRTPTHDGSLMELKAAAQLLQDLERSFLSDFAEKNSSFPLKEDKSVSNDATDRIGELATVGMAKHGGEASILSKIWIGRRMGMAVHVSCEDNTPSVSEDAKKRTDERDPMALMMAYLG